MTWDARNLKAGDRNFISAPLTIKSIRKFTLEEVTDPSWLYSFWPYWVEFEEDIIFSKSSASKGLPILGTTFDDIDNNSFRSNCNSNVFYYFVSYLNLKRNIPFRTVQNSDKSVSSFFLLSNTTPNQSKSKGINEIIAIEKKKWDNLGYIKEEDLIQENKSFVERNISYDFASYLKQKGYAEPPKGRIFLELEKEFYDAQSQQELARQRITMFDIGKNSRLIVNGAKMNVETNEDMQFLRADDSSDTEFTNFEFNHKLIKKPNSANSDERVEMKLVIDGMNLVLTSNEKLEEKENFAPLPPAPSQFSQVKNSKPIIQNYWKNWTELDNSWPYYHQEAICSLQPQLGEILSNSYSTNFLPFFLLLYNWKKTRKIFNILYFRQNADQETKDFQEIKISTQTKPTLNHLLGKGGYGEVYYGKWQLQDVAVKKLYLSLNNISETDRKSIEKEINILKNLRNRYIIQYYDTYSDSQEILIIMEYAENGTLTKFINNNEDKEHNWDFNNNLIKQMTLGLAYIHHEGIIHRDLKSMNILLTNGNQVKISDFGLAKVKVISSSQSRNSPAGSVRWMAPEVIKEQKYSEQSDVYSLGMVIWEIVAKCTVPFKDVDNDYSVMFKIAFKNEKETIPVDTPQIQYIIQECWKDNPSERISLEEILEKVESKGGNSQNFPETQDGQEIIEINLSDLNIQENKQEEQKHQIIHNPPKNS